MVKKPRLKRSAFDWAEKTTDKKETSVTQQKNPNESKQKATGIATEKEIAATNTNRQTASIGIKKRMVFVQYRTDDGQIVALQEILHQPEKSAKPLWLEIPNDNEARRIGLTGDLVDKKLLEIHQNYKVKKSGRSVKLVPKT